jgi:CheY-like chemotaxis protein
VGDPIRLHQIILNLVSNAVKFTTKGVITVGVSRIANDDDDRVNIRFAVTDTGIGIEENTLGRIFENFQQASSGTSRLFGGTGLGLAIVKQLVEQQGGTISVKSKINEGSTFSFTLKFNKTKAEAETEIGPIELDTEIKNIKILVVEDIALNQLLMKTFLDDFGFESDIALNGKEAVEKLLQENSNEKTKPYDIILMDLQMPVMNGFEATEHIRNQMRSTIPIIALTADVTTVDLAKCRAAGMNDYIAKPVDENLLYSKIVELVKKQSLKPPGVLGYKLNSSTPEPFEITLTPQIPLPKSVDLSYLVKRTKSNAKLIVEMISLYLEQTPILISTMIESLRDEEWGLLQSSVHKMIPSFSIMGIDKQYEDLAKELQEYAGLFISNQIEGVDNSTNLPSRSMINNLVIQLETVCSKACKELEIEHKYYLNTLTDGKQPKD